MKRAIEKTAPPMAFLLECSDGAVGNFQLARMAEAANLRSELHAVLDRLIDQMAQAALAGWFRQTNRGALKQSILETSDAKFDRIMARAKGEVRDQGRSQEETKDGAMPSPWLVRQRTYLTAAERRDGRSAIEKRCREKHIAAGKCERCSQPLAHHSVRECDVHLQLHRQRDARDRAKKGIVPGTQGRQPGTIKALKEANEKRKAKKRGAS